MLDFYPYREDHKDNKQLYTFIMYMSIHLLYLINLLFNLLDRFELWIGYLKYHHNYLGSNATNGNIGNIFSFIKYTYREQLYWFFFDIHQSQSTYIHCHHPQGIIITTEHWTLYNSWSLLLPISVSMIVVEIVWKHEYFNLYQIIRFNKST